MREPLSEEELTLLAAFPAAGRRPIDADEAARRTGMPKGLVRLANELLEMRVA